MFKNKIIIAVLIAAMLSCSKSEAVTDRKLEVKNSSSTQNKTQNAESEEVAGKSESRNEGNNRGNAPGGLFDTTPIETTAIFDNIYVIGTKSTVAYALKTSEGIIMLDSLWSDSDGKTIEKELIKAGLNPEEIKYILISHGHGDHYGGADYLQKISDAKILMTETDFKFMNSLNTGANSSRSTKPGKVDFVKDGDRITLGDTTVTIVETPGHTPGTMSFIFPAKDKGNTHMAALWGGTGIPRDREGQLKYRNSIEHFAKYAKEAKVVIGMSGHPFVENDLEKIESVQRRKGNEKNAFIVGEDEFSKRLDRLRKNVNEAMNK